MIAWNDKYSLADATLDEQHRMFINKANEYEEARKAGKTVEEISTYLRFLKEYAKIHFAEEERYMVEVHYPDIDVHTGIHDSFVSRLMDMIVKLNTAGETDVLAAEIGEFINDWLIGHIKTVDHALAVYVATGRRIPIVVR